MATGFSYDVFLSFRGEDTRTTFTDHLYAALTQAGVRTFRDDDAMDRGRILGPELKKAIRESAISIIVFSRNYATSKWCLDEVLTIIQEQERLYSKHEVVPVFYKVEPSDVRNQTGSFAEAFGEYDKKIEWMEKVKAWRDSLKKAGSLTGMVLTADGHEAKFISNIVNVIRKKLNYNLLYIEGKLVGIKDNVAEIESWLQDPSPDAVFFFIHGMGGIGKTTLSKCIFNSNHLDYDASCFLADIQEASKQPNGLLRLQSQLLSTILRSNKEEIIWNVYEGTVKVSNALCNKKVLLILDDISTRQHLTALLGSQQFYPGSKVIITTRHKWLLTEFKVHPKVHTIEVLGPDDSNKLFSMYAFHKDHPVEPYISRSELVVDRCRGHPLALKVLGSSLNGKAIDVWEDAICKLEVTPNPEIQKLLQLSYDTLEDTYDKDLFLHIACFFVGEDEEFIVTLLAECDLYPVVGIQNLMDRCLLYIEKGRVMMHQLIKEMGRDVVRQESPKDHGKRSRLWNHLDSFNVLKENEGTKKVHGLALDMRTLNGINSTSLHSGRKRRYEDFSGLNKENFKIGAIEKMKNLLLLQLDYATFSGSYKKLPKKLRLLRWHGFPLKSVPSYIPLQKLVVLDLRYSKLKQVWDGSKVIGTLKILNLSYSVELIKTPDFGGLPSLESLIFKGCLSLTDVCESIGCLERLVLLNISGCRSLTDFPCLPRSLESLQMNDCPKLFLGGPGQVQCLNSCSLPSLLVDIDVSRCNLFDNSFPKDWSNLFSLKKLNISDNHITSLPGCVKSLPGLEELIAGGCSQLQSVVDLPKSVTGLFIYGNMSLEVVQPTPNSLTYMLFEQCKKLCEVEGCFKVESIKNVDRKVIRYLGLENAYTENESIKVSYEFGIFSAFVPGKRLPCFMYKELGSTISFRVPSRPKGSRIIGLNVCFMSTSAYESSIIMYVEVNNKTKDLLWRYTPTISYVTCKNGGDCDLSYVWLSVWRTGNLLDDGDEIAVRINLGKGNVVECCVNMVYDVDEEEMDVVPLFNHSISWRDRMRVEVSDYVHTGKIYHFAIMNPFNTLKSSLVDWWGLKEDWTDRYIVASYTAKI